jgi:hypothetical protein
VVLINADAVEAQFLGVGERVDVLAVEVVALDRVVEAVRQPHPGRVVPGVEVIGQVRPGHQVEEEVLQEGLRATKLRGTTGVQGSGIV